MSHNLYMMSCFMVLTMSGCLHFDQIPWEPQQYKLEEIRREYSQGTYKETFRSLPYEEKMNICLAAFTQVHPPLMGMLNIFQGSDHTSADKVMREIVEGASIEVGYIVWMKVQIWKVIVNDNGEEYRDECCKILDTLKRYTGAFRDLCIAELEPGYCAECDGE